VSRFVEDRKRSMTEITFVALATSRKEGVLCWVSWEGTKEGTYVLQQRWRQGLGNGRS
jgi:hypothetical protein